MCVCGVHILYIHVYVKGGWGCGLCVSLRSQTFVRRAGLGEERKN